MNIPIESPTDIVRVIQTLVHRIEALESHVRQIDSVMLLQLKNAKLDEQLSYLKEKQE